MTSQNLNVGYSVLLRSPRYLPFFISQILTNLGDGLMAVAIIYVALNLGVSPWELGMITAGVTLARGFLGPIGGIIGDRMNKRRYLILVEGMRACVTIALFLLFQTGLLGIWHLLLFGVVISTLFAVSVPVAKSIIPQLVDAPALQSANALVQTITWPAFFLGSGLLAAFLQFGMQSVLFMAIAIFFAVSTGLLILLPSIDAVIADKTSRKSWLDDLRDGYRELSSDRVLLVRVWTYAVFTFFWRGALQIILPLAILVHLDSPAWLFGVLMFVNGAGEFVANLVVGRTKIARPLVFSFLCELVLGIGLVFIAIALFVPAPTVPLLVGSLLIGIGAATIDIPLLMVIQKHVSQQNMGKVISYWFTIGSTGGALGNIAFGLYFELIPFGIGTAIIAAALTVFGVSILAWAHYSSDRALS